MTDTLQMIKKLALMCKDASLAMGRLSTRQKNEALSAMAGRIMADAEAILAANLLDIRAGREKGLSEAMLDRLKLDRDRLAKMADAILEIAALPDPVGEITEMVTRPSGIKVGRMRIPLGVIAMIYEARPNVTSDAAALCLKAGNAVILRGGSEAFNSNQAIAASSPSASYEPFASREAAVNKYATPANT